MSKKTPPVAPLEPTDLTMGIDLGGTKTAIALVNAAGEMVESHIISTPPTEEGVVLIPANAAADVLTPQVKAVGVGAAGLIKFAEGLFVWGANVAGHQVPLKKIFQEELGLPTVVDNDANVAALAEARIGAAVGFQHVLLITLGTGLGGGWIINGYLYRGRDFAGEIGHMTVSTGGQLCTCGQRGCWETFASGRRLDQMARDLAVANPGGLIAKLAGYEVPVGEDLTQAALEGDPDATAALGEVAHWLGKGIASLVAAFDPEIVVVGGGVSRAGELLLSGTRAAFAETLEGGDHRDPTPIVKASLGEKAGVIGAALLAREFLQDLQEVKGEHTT